MKLPNDQKNSKYGSSKYDKDGKSKETGNSNQVKGVRKMKDGRKMIKYFSEYTKSELGELS